MPLPPKKKEEQKEKNNERLPSNENKYVKQGLNFWIQALLSVVTVAVYPAIFLYFQNADETKFSEVVIPLLIFIAVGLILFTTMFLFIKCANKAAIITNLFMLMLLNYSLLENGINKIFPDLRYWHVLPIFLFILSHLVWFIYKKLDKEIANTAVLVLCVVFCGLILFNGVIAAPTIINKVSIERQAKEQKNITTHPVGESTDMPNIYFLIFDEYSSIDFMKKYYNYDNSAFTDYLEEKGFSVSYSSHNESISTPTITANLVNFNYIVENGMQASEKDYFRKNNLLFKYFGEKKYRITGVGNVSVYGLNNSASAISDIYSKTVDGKTIVDIIMESTAFRPFYYSPTYAKAQRSIIFNLDYLKNPENYSKNNFIFAHIICPHEPFYFNMDGKPYKKPESNWNDDKYYLGQYIFVTNQIKEIVESIITNDPNSVIILQSDHSARASSDDKLFLEKFKLEDMSSILNAVYYRGDPLDIEGLSGVNTIRHLLNEMFGEDFEMIEVPLDTYKYK